MRHVLCVFLMVGICLMLTACGVGRNKPRTKTSDKNIRIIDYSQLRALLDDPKLKPLLVDVRIHKAQFDAGHIPGAVHIPMPKLRASNKQISEAKLIIIYSADRLDSLSTASTKKLMRIGYKVMEYRGGFTDWQGQQGKGP